MRSLPWKMVEVKFSIVHVINHTSKWRYGSTHVNPKPHWRKCSFSRPDGFPPGERFLPHPLLVSHWAPDLIWRFSESEKKNNLFLPWIEPRSIPSMPLVIQFFAQCREIAIGLCSVTYCVLAARSARCRQGATPTARWRPPPGPTASLFLEQKQHTSN